MNVHGEKAERIDRVDNTLTRSELLRRLPELEMITDGSDSAYDNNVREATIQTFLDGVPDYFWERPASSSGKYHPPDESGKYGVWLHTKRVFAEYIVLSESMVELGEITEGQAECGKAAALLHDTMTYGWPSDNNDHTVNDHDIIAASMARYIGKVPPETVHLIHSHMGPWGEGKKPRTRNEILLHLADKSSAKSSHKPGVYSPSEELVEAFPELKVIEP